MENYDQRLPEGIGHIEEERNLECSIPWCLRMTEGRSEFMPPKLN